MKEKMKEIAQRISELRELSEVDTENDKIKIAAHKPIEPEILHFREYALRRTIGAIARIPG